MFYRVKYYLYEGGLNIKKSIIIIGLITLLLSGCKAQQEWNIDTLASKPMFRGNLQQTGFYDTKGVGKLNKLKWQFTTRMGVTTSPIIHDQTVYFGSEEGVVYGIDINTGEEKVNFETNGPITSTPAVEKETIYFGDKLGNLKAIDLQSGEEKWKFSSKTPQNIPSPVTTNGMVFFGGSQFCALNAENGKEIWTFESKDQIRSAPAVANGLIYFVDSSENLYALDAFTGKKLWSVSLEKGDYDLGQKYFWLDKLSPAIYNETLFYGNTSGNFYAFDAETGEEKWKLKVSNEISSSPAVYKDKVFFGTTGAKLYAVDIATGSEEWSFNSKGEIWSSPSIADGLIYYGDRNGDINALDVETGNKVWTYHTNGNIRFSPLVWNGEIYFGSGDENLYVIKSLDEKEHQLLSAVKVGKMDGIDFSIGTPIKKALDKWGKPKEKGWFGGNYYAYDDVIFWLDGNDKIARISVIEEKEIFGVKIGMPISKVKSTLGNPTSEYIIEKDDELNGGDYCISYVAGDYQLTFYSKGKDTPVKSAELIKVDNTEESKDSATSDLNEETKLSASEVKYSKEIQRQLDELLSAATNLQALMSNAQVESEIWRDQIVIPLAKMQYLSDSAEEMYVPTKFQDVHNAYADALSKYSLAADYIATSIDNLDISQLEKGMLLIDEGGTLLAKSEDRLAKISGRSQE